MFIGRDAQQQELTDAVASARQGRGGFVLLGGEAGVGKTRLAEECLATAGLPVLRGPAREETAPPFGPVAAALRGALSDPGTAKKRLGALTGHLAPLLPDLGLSPAAPPLDSLDEVLVSALLTAVGSEPAVIFFDDLQWADNATLGLMPLLAERTRHAPVLVLATYRSDEIPRGHPFRRLRNELRRARRLNEITVSALGRDDAALLLESVLGKHPVPALADLIFERTQGIPLFVEELARVMAEGDLLRDGADGVELAPGTDVPLPESVRDAVVLRLDRVSEAARRHLEVAAVVGQEFDLDLVLDLAEGADPAAIDELFTRGFIHETAGGRGAFRHALTREAVRSEILWTRRRELHRRIAERLAADRSDPELVAEHWLGARDHARAREALLDSAVRSCAVHAYRDAAGAAHRALEMWPEGDEEARRLDTLRRLADCAQAAGQLADAVRAWREYAASPLVKGSPIGLAEAHRALATLHGLQGAWEQSVEARRAAAEAYLAAGLSGEAAVEELALAGRFTASLQYESAVEKAEAAAALADAGERLDVKARALGVKGNVLAMAGRAEEGIRTVKAGLSLALEHSFAEAASEVYRRLASALEYSSDYVGAREAYTTALNFCRDQGEDALAQVCLGCMSWVFLQTGDWGRAQSLCREVLGSKDTPPASAASAAASLGLIAAFRGEIRTARKHLRRALADARRLDVAALELLALWGLALVEEAEGAEDGAASYYRQLLDLWEKTQDRHDAIAPLLFASTFFGERAREAETTQCAKALGEITAATGNPEAMAALAHALGEAALGRGRAVEAAAQFEEGLVHLEKLDVPFLAAMVESRAGVARARAGESESALRRLETAYRTAKKIGARPLALRVAAELEALGATPEDRPRAGKKLGVDADRATLTRRQLEVLRLAAEGLTNKEIADRLFLSARTVDMHVSNLLDRLDARARMEAVGRARELGLLD